LNSGLKNVVIDYSVDGSDWTILVISQFEKGTGANNYDGFDGPIFQNNSARYVLLTAISNWGDINCSGITEIKFNLTELNEIEEINTNIPSTLFAMEVNTDGHGASAVNANKVLFMKNETATVTAMAYNGYWQILVRMALKIVRATN